MARTHCQLDARRDSRVADAPVHRDRGARARRVQLQQMGGLRRRARALVGPQQNRGRLAADLLPDLVDLPSHGLTNATIEDAVGAPSEHWDPADEAKASKRSLGRRRIKLLHPTLIDLRHPRRRSRS